MSVSDETLRTAIVLYLERLPKSELVDCNDVAKALLPEEYASDMYDASSRVLRILKAGYGEDFEHLSHRGWRTMSDAARFKRLESWLGYLVRNLDEAVIHARAGRLDLAAGQLGVVEKRLRWLVPSVKRAFELSGRK